MVTETSIREAYIEMRKTNNTIPDEVLDFMKQAAIDRITGKDLNYYTRAELQEHLNRY